MDITVSAHVLGPVNWTGPGTLRLVADTQFIDSDGETILAGSKTANYRTVAITLVATVGTLASFVISSTTDSPTDGDARYSGYIYDAAGKFQGIFFQGWRIPTTIEAPVTITKLKVYNDIPVSYRGPNGPVTHIRSGTAIVTGGVAQVDLEPAEVDSEYRVAFAPSGLLTNLHWEDKTPNSFTIACTELTAVAVDWILTRN